MFRYWTDRVTDVRSLVYKRNETFVYPVHSKKQTAVPFIEITGFILILDEPEADNNFIKLSILVFVKQDSGYIISQQTYCAEEQGVTTKLLLVVRQEVGIKDLN